MYAKNSQKQLKMAYFGPQMDYEGGGPHFFHIFVVQELEFDYI